ncbi:MAG: ATP-binding protein [Magnetococcales bacterium]|nr:ATP-binding protein [Magnetococcales bacterium]
MVGPIDGRISGTVGARIGANVLDTLTTGMYTNPLDAVREYVANARDAIVTARDQGLIPAKHPGRIQISIDTRSRSLTIRDEGIGLPSETACQRLVDVGMSEKSTSRENNRIVGFRGIGRLAGIAYCETLEFRTSAVGDTVETIVCFDCVALRKGIWDSTRNPETEAVALLNECTTKKTNRVNEDEHFFEVRMQGIGNDVGDRLLNNDHLMDYLGQNAPVDLDGHRMIYKQEIIKEYDKEGINIPVVQIILGRDGQQGGEVFRPYKSSYQTAKRVNSHERIEIRGIDFLTPSRQDFQYWGWVGRSNLLGQIPDPSSSGIRIRKQGIGFGGAELMSEIFRGASASSERFNHWFIGEIHIFHPDVIPNGRRDGFEETEAWTAIRADLLIHARTLSKQCHEASEARNMSPQKAQQRADAAHESADLLLKSGVATPEKKEEGIAKLDRAIERIVSDKEKAVKRIGADEGRKYDRILGDLDKKKSKLQQVKYASTDMESGLDRPQVKILRLILEAAQETLEENHYARLRAAIESKLRERRAGSPKAK